MDYNLEEATLAKEQVDDKAVISSADRLDKFIKNIVFNIVDPQGNPDPYTRTLVLNQIRKDIGFTQDVEYIKAPKETPTNKPRGGLRRF